MSERKTTRRWRTVQANRLVETEHKTALINERLDSGDTTHLSPFSTLIAAMGNYWAPGSLEAVHAMAQHTFDSGYEVCVIEEHDRCYNDFDAIGIMRNMAYQRAIREGWEYLLYVDNDVLPEPEILVRLLHRRVPIITPLISYADGDEHGQALASVGKDQGLAMVGSYVISFVLFRTSVFLPWALNPFWQDAIGADEGYHFSKLEMAGHRPFVDTDVEVVVQSAPHFPLDDVLDARRTRHFAKATAMAEFRFGSASREFVEARNAQVQEHWAQNPQHDAPVKASTAWRDRLS